MYRTRAGQTQCTYKSEAPQGGQSWTKAQAIQIRRRHEGPTNDNTKGQSTKLYIPGGTKWRQCKTIQNGSGINRPRARRNYRKPLGSCCRLGARQNCRKGAGENCLDRRRVRKLAMLPPAGKAKPAKRPPGRSAWIDVALKDLSCCLPWERQASWTVFDHSWAICLQLWVRLGLNVAPK